MAALAVLAVDRTVFRASGVWDWLEPRMTRQLFAGIVQDRRELDRMAASRSGRPAVIVGSSRAYSGLRVEELSPEERAPLDGYEVGKVAHAGIDPFVIRTFATELAELPPALTILVLSEFDTHHPLDLRPKTTAGSPLAVLELARDAEPRSTWTHRTDLLRLFTGSLVATYRYRGLLEEGVFDPWLEFSLRDRRYRAVRLEDWAFEQELEGETLRTEAQRAVDEAMGTLQPRLALQHLGELRRGPHVELQEGMLERTVARLRAAGSDVLIVEGPVHPLGRTLYPSGLREEFLVFAERLRERHGARFLPLEESGPFEPEDFGDVNHLNGRGARKLTLAVMERLGE